MSNDVNSSEDRSFGAFGRVPVEVRVAVGRIKISVSELLLLRQGSVVQLNRHVTEPVELIVGDKLIAYGELEEMDGDHDGQLAVRIVRVANEVA